MSLYTDCDLFKLKYMSCAVGILVQDNDITMRKTAVRFSHDFRKYLAAEFYTGKYFLVVNTTN